jgi:predicted signal transduction protein with EAL and GGDEF domain
VRRVFNGIAHLRLRHVLFVLLVLAAQIPVTGLGGWVRNHLQEAAVEEAEERHMLLVRGLASTLERYHERLKTALLMVASAPGGIAAGGAARLEADFGITAICRFTADGSAAALDAMPGAKRCAALADAGFIEDLAGHAGTGDARSGAVTVTPLMRTPSGAMHLFAVMRDGDGMVAAEVGGGYLEKLAKNIRFGRMGHAVIFDAAGRVLAHPKAEWVASSHDISALDPVKRALARNADGSRAEGFTTFHSPALNADMVAGFSEVTGAGWGVMVPQPRAELELQSFVVLQPLYAFLGAAFIAALVVARVFAGRIAGPLERLTAAALRAGSVSQLHEVMEEKGRWAPSETKAIVSAFNGMVRSLRASEAEMRRLAYADSLTGLLNRASFQRLAGAALERAARHGAPAALFYFDIDDFKQINDQRGHAAGDQVLAALAAAVQGLVARTVGEAVMRDPVAELEIADGGHAGNLAFRPCFSRFGGDEFVLLMPGFADRAAAEAFAAALQHAVRQPIALMSGSVTPSVSIGIAHGGPAPLAGDRVEALLHMADAALYHAKSGGKGRHCTYAPEKGIRSINEVRDEIAAAIMAEQMVLHYQPKVDARSGVVHSLEALVRWNHPGRGLLMPAAFIHAIDDSDVVVLLGEAVMKMAAADAAAMARGGRNLNIAINVASRHFGKRGFAERMSFLAASSGLGPSQFILEITEEDAMRPEEDAGDIIAAVKAAGFGVALDDYGRGYSNLQRLAQLPVDSIKIDRSLIAQVNAHTRTREIVAATVAMAEALDCRVVAEGIETAAQAALLRRLGCHELQGYFYAKPMPMEALLPWLDARGRNPVAALRESIATGA